MAQNSWAIWQQLREVFNFNARIRCSCQRFTWWKHGTDKGKLRLLANNFQLPKNNISDFRLILNSWRGGKHWILYKAHKACKALQYDSIIDMLSSFDAEDFRSDAYPRPLFKWLFPTTQRTQTVDESYQRFNFKLVALNPGLTSFYRPSYGFYCSSFHQL